MNSPTLHLLRYFILFSALFNTFPSLISVAAQEPAPVVDIAGNYVRAGTDYYILPVVRGRGGGLTLASVGNRTCPLNVAQEPQEVDAGLPLYFSPVDSNETVVRVSTDQNIIFNASSICVQSTLWVLQRNETSGRYLIATGGVSGNPGAGTVNNWFRIEEYEGDYKLVFCPSVCSFCRVACGDIGVFVEGAERLLGFALNDSPPPFRVVFRKA